MATEPSHTAREIWQFLWATNCCLHLTDQCVGMKGRLSHMYSWERTHTHTRAVFGELFKGVESSEERLVHLICHLVNTAHSLINAETGASQSESIRDLTLSFHRSVFSFQSTSHFSFKDTVKNIEIQARTKCRSRKCVKCALWPWVCVDGLSVSLHLFD